MCFIEFRVLTVLGASVVKLGHLLQHVRTHTERKIMQKDLMLHMPGTMATELILNKLKLLTKEILDKVELSNHGTPLQQKMQIILTRSKSNILFF
mgnify:CR=1 FL=1